MWLVSVHGYISPYVKKLTKPVFPNLIMMPISMGFCLIHVISAHSINRKIGDKTLNDTELKHPWLKPKLVVHQN